MLEKEIMKKIVEKLDPHDNTIAKKFLEKSKIIFMFGRGFTGQYFKGMVKPLDGGGLKDFDPSDITGVMFPDYGDVEEGSLNIASDSLIQDLQNQIADLKSIISENQEIIDENAQLLKAANETIAEMNKKYGDVE